MLSIASGDKGNEWRKLEKNYAMHKLDGHTDLNDCRRNINKIDELTSFIWRREEFEDNNGPMRENLPLSVQCLFNGEEMEGMGIHGPMKGEPASVGPILQLQFQHPFQSQKRTKDR